MKHDPERVADKIEQRDDVDTYEEMPVEVDKKLLTTLIGYDPRARLLTVFVLHDDREMHQAELMARAGINDLDAYAEALADLLRLEVVEVATATDGIPYYHLNPLSGAGAAIAGANEALLQNQVRQLSDNTGDDHES